MHTIRLLQVAEEILRDGKLKVKRLNREQMLEIKSGKFAYDRLLSMADKLMENIETYCSTSSLPDFPCKEKTEQVLIEIREELYT